MKLIYSIIPFLAILGETLADWDPNTAGADFSTLTEGSPIGNTNPTGTYAIALETYDSNYALHKRGYTKKNVHKAAAARKHAADKKHKQSQPRKKYKTVKQNKGKSHKQIGKAHKNGRKDAVVSQIGDGQIQGGINTVLVNNAQTTTTPPTAPTTSAQTTTAAAALVTQIGDGQIQAPVSSEQPSTVTVSSTSYSTVYGVCDAQSTSTATVTAAANSNSNSKAKRNKRNKRHIFAKAVHKKDAVASQTGNGQSVGSTVVGSYTSYTTVPAVCNAPSSSFPTATATASVSSWEEEDGQVYADVTGSTYDDDGSLPSVCSSAATFSFYFQNGIIYDQAGRIGSIVDNYQLQFDGPPPQAGTIYAAGWCITDDNYLALGDDTLFYACAQDGSYKIYWDQAYDYCVEVMIKLNLLDDSC